MRRMSCEEEGAQNFLQKYCFATGGAALELLSKLWYNIFHVLTSSTHLTPDVSDKRAFRLRLCRQQPVRLVLGT